MFLRFLILPVKLLSERLQQILLPLDNLKHQQYWKGKREKRGKKIPKDIALKEYEEKKNHIKLHCHKISKL